MSGSINGDEITDSLEYVKSLDFMSSIRILLELCKDSNLSERIIAMSKAALSCVDSEEIADQVFSSLNSIMVEDLWDNSGNSRWGYHEPTEVAFEMLGDELHQYVATMNKYRVLGMKKEEKELCKGIISGILRYGHEGSNEFHDWVPDDPYIHADNILYNWKENNTAEDIEEVQAVYDGYFSDQGEDSVQILVDADSCPVKQVIVSLAKQWSIPVIMLFDTAHEYSDGYSEVIIVDKQANSVDLTLMLLLNRGDVVVTQDYGLAAMALGKGAKVINQNGLIFTDENIDKLLMDRHIGQEVRRRGGKTKGPAKRTKEDDARFKAEFERLLAEVN